MKRWIVGYVGGCKEGTTSLWTCLLGDAAQPVSKMAIEMLLSHSRSYFMINDDKYNNRSCYVMGDRMDSCRDLVNIVRLVKVLYYGFSRIREVRSKQHVG